MNRHGFTLVELLIAASIFVVVISSFTFIIKYSANYQALSKKKTAEFYVWRSEMERLRQVSFEQLPALANPALARIIALSPDLVLIKVGQLETLRSRF